MRISDWSSDVCSSDLVLGQWDHEALGIASFGPLDLDPSSPRYGRIVHTPKPGWNQAFLADLAGGKPFALDTDANGAAIAEGRSEEHTSELQSLMRISYAVFCLKKKNKKKKMHLRCTLNRVNH